MSNCKNFKIKINRSLECKLTGKTITWQQCKNCKLREYNLTNIKPIKKRTNRLNKLENNRHSLFTDDLSKCIICSKKKDNLHEVFFGSNRINSIKYGLVIPLCIEHHQEMHKNAGWQDYWHKLGQEEFEKHYSRDNFVSIFKKNYL